MKRVENDDLKAIFKDLVPLKSLQHISVINPGYYCYKETVLNSKQEIKELQTKE